MSWTPTEHTWEPTQAPSRHADTTANIHRAIAWFYGVIGVISAAVVAFMDSNNDRGGIGVGIGIGIVLVVGAIVALHAMLAIGARKRSDASKVGSVIVGVLMLFGFPLGTIIGGLLIYNSVQNWPPKRGPSAAPAGPDLRGL